PLRHALVRAGLLHGYYIRRGGLTLDAKINVRFVFDKWSGARDLNPGPHGPELCELSSTNVGNDRFRFGLSAKEAGCIVIQGYSPAGLLHEVLHGPVIRFRALHCIAQLLQPTRASILPFRPRLGPLTAMALAKDDLDTAQC